MKKGLKYVFGFLCFALGVAFSIGALASLRETYFDSMDLVMPGMLGATLLLGSYFLLRSAISSRSFKPETSSPGTTVRLQNAADGFIKLINEDSNPNEVKASAYALSGLAGFLTGFAAAKLGTSFEEFLTMCREGFEKSARDAHKAHQT